MNKEDRVLLVQDIMSRIPYNVKFYLDGMMGSTHHVYCRPRYVGNDIDDYICELDFFNDGNFIDIEHFKPILYPMQSMTEEQKKEEYEICKGYLIGYESKLIEFYRRNHIDYHGLIPKGLAKDASKLNTY